MLGMLGRDKGERLATVRDEMHEAMETESASTARSTPCRRRAKLATLRDRYRRGLKLDDRNRAFNTEWLSAIELGFTSRSPR